MKILARHRWVSDCVITESIDENDGTIRRFTATIHGWRNWKIYQGKVSDRLVKKVVETVKSIKSTIEEDMNSNGGISPNLTEALFKKREYFIDGN